jgi:hypothetical protein
MPTNALIRPVVFYELKKGAIMWPFNKQNESCRETVQPGGVLREAADPRNEAIDYIHRENVDCKTCGCLIRKVNAIAGEDYEIGKSIPVMGDLSLGGSPTIGE